MRYETPRSQRARAWLRRSSPIASASRTAVPVFVQPSHGFQPAGERRHADHHGRPGHGHRAVPRVSRRAPRHRCERPELALLRRPEARARIFFYRRTNSKAWLADGHLTRLDLAFSRDQAEKIYVQHRMMENAAETVVVAGRGRALLRLRRRQPHGEGRGRRAASSHRDRRRQEPRTSRGVRRRN